MSGMSYLFFLAVAFYVMGVRALALAMATPGSHTLASVPTHLTWWVGFRWGYPHRSAMSI
jgi:hypothetical protein